MWERACPRMRWVSAQSAGWHTAFAAKPAPTSSSRCFPDQCSRAYRRQWLEEIRVRPRLMLEPGSDPASAKPAVNSSERACPRWGAKRPLNLTTQFVWRNAVTVLGLLRSPTRGKPARHKKSALSLEITSLLLSRHRTHVGAGLPANAVGQCPISRLAHRLREQARSHME